MIGNIEARGDGNFQVTVWRCNRPVYAIVSPWVVVLQGTLTQAEIRDIAAVLPV
jgi:hypothetical protein